ncbi:nitrilase [Halopseudomonas xinjiangensis]|uniref:Nitrilase n=1 Tax=Halopseudomonas xinjiangensis TaxID=487184 RepID=A0A1H1VXS0_9GAMM|nr:carbon-nitrogen hydrolase family protein [Halopseudomonas xinjiangensis]SDS88869.1 nitrilase [Halopseudomonas xinjiangensis]
MNHVAAIQMTSGPDVEANLERAAELIADATTAGAGLVLLPECFAALGAKALASVAAAEYDGRGPIRRFLAEQARLHGIWLLGGSIPLPRQADGKARASCLVVDPAGEEVARYDKLHLFDVEVADGHRSYRESKDYQHGDQPVCVDTPVGRVGLSICYDVRFPELYQQLCRDGAGLIVVPSAFTRVTGAAHWEVLLRARAIENQCYVLAANQSGQHPGGRETFGHSCLIDPWGEIVDLLAEGEGIVCGAIDPQHIQNIRERMPVARHRRFAVADQVVPAAKES